jgi:uncharacterized protein YecT (DUF1311 family)
MAWSCAAGATAAYPNTEGFGVEFAKSEDWYRHCMRALRAAPPPAPARRPTLRCNATDLYYEKRDRQHTSAAEWRQVGDCAAATGDDAVLMMLHANGYGVPRDADRAIYHACRLDAAKAEMELRVGYLASPAAAADAHPFDLCDHITSGRMGGVCAAIGKGRDDRLRAARLDRFAAGLPPPARPAFARLRTAAAAFTRMSAREVDMTGTGGPGFTFRHSGRRDAEFLDTLLKAASGKLPHATPAQFTELDRELNDVYRDLLTLPSEQENHPERIRSSTVSREEVRSTERAWLAYRDAWEPFLSAAGLPADVTAVKAALTRQRISQLKGI